MTVHDALQIATEHHRSGRLAEAEAIYRRILAEYPDEPDSLHLLGLAEHQRGRSAEAIALLERAVALQPQSAAFRANFATALADAGERRRAIAMAEQALECDPVLAEAHYSLGVWRLEEGQPDAAEQSLVRALQLRPTLPEAHCALGNVFAAREQINEAIAAYREALRLHPGYAEAHYNLANMLLKNGDTSAAIAGYRTAVQLRPDYADAHFNLGNALHGIADLDGAAVAYDACLRAQPAYAGALWHRGNVWKDRGDIRAAITDWRRALALVPDDAGLHSTLVLYLRYDPATSPAEVAAEEARWNERHAVPLRSTRAPLANDRTPDRPLRIGYVSADFWDHAVGRNILPLLANHDRTRFSVHCYANGTRVDALTASLRGCADEWHDVARLSDATLADLIRGHRIDVLVDLSLHTGGNRLLTLARQPAPVQFSFGGYPGHTGVETIAHRISDPHLEGSDSAAAGTHLIPSFWCFDPIDESPAVNPLPALQNGFVTFGCLNHACKVNAEVLALWARVLQAVPHSRLQLLTPEGSHREKLRTDLAALGLPPSRVTLLSPAPRSAYLHYFQAMDVTIDTFPYGGHTTSLESLWMGVPVITLPGPSIVSRGGASQLRNLGLPELIARDADDFVRIAAGLAGDLPRLATLRETMRERMQNSVLMDARRFAREIEAAYEKAWRLAMARDPG